MEPLSAQQQQQQQHTGGISASSTSSGPQQLFRVSPAGLDTVTFLLAAGPSEPLRPLADVASGGEAARVMLALKAAAAAVAAGSTAATAATSAAGSNAAAGGPPPVLVLDELDAGVGSRLGAPIGRLLQKLVAGAGPTASQVLVVTHTPQVGAVQGVGGMASAQPC
jgi:DNA repair ATPase RecN